MYPVFPTYGELIDKWSHLYSTPISLLLCPSHPPPRPPSLTTIPTFLTPSQPPGSSGSSALYAAADPHPASHRLSAAGGGGGGAGGAGGGGGQQFGRPPSFAGEESFRGDFAHGLPSDLMTQVGLC